MRKKRQANWLAEKLFVIFFNNTLSRQRRRANGKKRNSTLPRHLHRILTILAKKTNTRLNSQNPEFLFCVCLIEDLPYVSNGLRPFPLGCTLFLTMPTFSVHFEHCEVANVCTDVQKINYAGFSSVPRAFRHVKRRRHNTRGCHKSMCLPLFFLNFFFAYFVFV